MRKLLVVGVIGVLCAPVAAQEVNVDLSAQIARICGLRKAGQQALDAGKLDVAVQSYEEAVEAQKQILGADNPETVETMRLLAGVYEKQERWADAYSLREALVDLQRRGDGKLTDDVVWAAVNVAFNWGAELYGEVDAPPKDLAGSRNLIRRLRERSKPFEGTLTTDNALDMVAQWNEAWTEYRSGNATQAIKALQPGIGCFPQNAWGHMAMALFCWQADEKDLARDWYLAACEGMTEAHGPDKDLDDVKKKAGAIIFAGESQPPQVALPEYVEVYDRLLSAYPNVVPLYIRRGVSAVRVGRLEQALGDFRQARELRPHDAWTWYHLANTLLLAGEVEEYEKTCEGMHAKFATSPNPFDRHLLIIVWSLAPNPNIDAAEMLELANRPDRTDDARIARVLYRCGRYDEVLTQLATKPDGILLAMTEFAQGKKAEAERNLAVYRPHIQSRRNRITNYFNGGGSVMEYTEGEILLREAEKLIGPGLQSFFDRLAQVLVGDWTATGTISPEGADDLFKAGDSFEMVASLRLAAGGKAVVGTEKITVVNRPDVSIESAVMITWDPVEMSVWILAPWSDGSSEIGNLTSVEPNGFRGTYIVHMPDGRQESCDIAMEMESNDKFVWVLKTGPRAGQCLSVWQRTGK